MKKMMLVALVISSLTASVASAITANDVVQKACIDCYPATFMLVPNAIASGYAWHTSKPGVKQEPTLQASVIANFVASAAGCAAYYACKQPNLVPGEVAGKLGLLALAAVVGGYLSSYVHLRDYKQRNPDAKSTDELAKEGINWTDALTRGFGLSALGLAAVEAPKWALGMKTIFNND